MSEVMYLFTAEVTETKGAKPKTRRCAFPADRPIGEIMDALKDDWGDVASITVKPARITTFASIIADHIATAMPGFIPRRDTSGGLAGDRIR